MEPTPGAQESSRRSGLASSRVLENAFLEPLVSTERSVELLQGPLSRGDLRCDDRESKPIHVLPKPFMVALEGQDLVRELGVQTMKRGEDYPLFDSEVRVERALEPKHRRFAVSPLPLPERLRDLADEDIELSVLSRDARSLTRKPYPQSRLAAVMVAHTVLSGGVTDRGSQGWISASMPDACRFGATLVLLYTLYHGIPSRRASAFSSASTTPPSSC